MFWILLFITFFNFTSGNRKHDRYIDLLPEKEKQEFLEKIARRILAEVNSIKVPENSHVEISDEVLDVHSAYVRGVIKDEADNFKNVSEISEKINMTLSNDTQIIQSNKREIKRTKRRNMEVRPLEMKKPLQNGSLMMPVKVIYDTESSASSSTSIKTTQINQNTKDNLAVFESTTASVSTFSSNNYNSNSDILMSGTKNPEDVQKLSSKGRNVEYTSTDSTRVWFDTDKTIEIHPENQAIIKNVIQGNSNAPNLEIDRNEASDKDFSQTEPTTAKYVTTLKESGEDSNYKTNNDQNITNRKYVNSSKKSLDIDQDKMNIKLSTTKLKSYEVWEIDPKSLPFVKSNKKSPVTVSQQPHYAPVYNYDPENVYFNPNSRYQPNAESVENLDQVEMKVLRSRFQNNAMKPSSQYVTYHSMNFNSNDRVDVDYYSGRNDEYQNLRNSNEDIYSHSDSLKNRIRDRRIRYFLDEIENRIKVINETRTVPNKDNKRVKATKSPIPFDYYFDRLSYTKLERDVKHIKPVTQNPINSIMTTENNKKRDRISSIDDSETSANVQFDYKSLLRVLRDMISEDNDALVNYNWLQSTVDVRAGATKMIYLIESYTYKNKIHPKDLELLKYVYFLYILSVKDINKESQSLNDGLSFKYPKPRQNHLLYNKHTHRKNRRNYLKNHGDEGVQVTALFELEDLMWEYLFHLDDFHSTIKKIAVSSTYRTQDWYNDIKRLYLEGASDRQLGAVLLHFSLMKVLFLIHESNVPSRGFKKYAKGHPREVKRAKKECVFAMRVLQELRPK